MPLFEIVLSDKWSLPNSGEVWEAIHKKNTWSVNVTKMFHDKILVVQCDKRPVDLRRYGITWKEVK